MEFERIFFSHLVVEGGSWLIILNFAAPYISAAVPTSQSCPSATHSSMSSFASSHQPLFLLALCGPQISCSGSRDTALRHFRYNLVLRLTNTTTGHNAHDCCRTPGKPPKTPLHSQPVL